jgi:hypothetical protein
MRARSQTEPSQPSRLAPEEAVPCCLSFSGDNPVEYWNEDEPAGPGPFDMAKVNAALAG